ASLLTRAAGVAPVLAGFAALVLRRRWRDLGYYTLGVLLLAIPWGWWVIQNPADPALDAFYSASTYGEWNIITHFSWREKLDVLLVNTLHLAALGQFWGVSSGSWLGQLLALVCSALVLHGLWISRASPVVLMVLATFAIVLVYVWPPVRYIVPILPLVVWLGYVGGRRFRPALAIIAVVFLAFAGIDWLRTANNVRQKGSMSFSAEAWVFDWHALTKQLDWVKRETPPDAVLTTILDPTYYLFTGRQAMRPFEFHQLLLYYNLRGQRDNPFGTSDFFRRRVVANKVDYVIVTPRDQLEPVINDLLKTAPGSFQPVSGSPQSGYVIYQVDRTRLQAD
ncbi:MAG: hypothetical protein ACREUU_11560, partial [Gammaproteobacteria bacterium]